MQGARKGAARSRNTLTPMHSTITESAPAPAITFPCLMRSQFTGNVVLFTADKTGVLVHPKTNLCFGRESPAWGTVYDASNWQPFNGTVHLSNNPPEQTSH